MNIFCAVGIHNLIKVAPNDEKINGMCQQCKKVRYIRPEPLYGLGYDDSHYMWDTYRKIIRFDQLKKNL